MNTQLTQAISRLQDLVSAYDNERLSIVIRRDEVVLYGEIGAQRPIAEGIPAILEFLRRHYQEEFKDALVKEETYMKKRHRFEAALRLFEDRAPEAKAVE